MVFVNLVLWFTIYSVVGWCYESLFCSIQAQELVNRGFLFGPYLPIYGFGAIFLILLLHKHMNNISLFFIAFFVTTAFEYSTSWLMEVIFHKTWWDYTNYALQLNGRVCLLASILFGLFGIVLVKKIHPVVQKLTDRLSNKTKVISASIISCILFVDFVFSILHTCSVL